MSRNIFIAIAAAIVGALIVVFYNILVPPPPPAPPGGPETPCTGVKCSVDIFVYGECSNPNVISAIPPVKPIARGNANPLIEWTIRTGGYTFASNGIDFPSSALTEFYNGHAVGQDKFQWNDKNDNNTYYKYTINLVHNGVACAPLDPGVINGQ